MTRHASRLDLKTICEHHIRFFGEPAPMDYYQFQVLVIGEGYGGLEHRASTSLITQAAQPAEAGAGCRVDDDYRDFLGALQPRVFSYLERQAYQARGVSALRSAAVRFTPIVVGLRRHHFLLRRPGPVAQRPDRRWTELSRTARADHDARAAWSRTLTASRRRSRASTPGPSFTSRTKTPPTRSSATMPRAA